MTMADEHSPVLSPGDFGRSLHRFLQASLAQAPPQEPEVARRVREHLGVERLVELPILTRTFGAFDHPNLQVALDGLLAGGAWSAQTLGLRSQQALYGGESLGQIVLLAGGDGLESGLGLTSAALEHVTVSLGPDESIACMANALLLLRSGERAVAALISRNDERMGGAAVRLDVLAADRADGERLLGEIEALMREHNVYRGRVVAFGGDRYEGTVLTVHALPAVERGAIVLPDGALERIERHALGPMRHRERLLAAGRHLKELLRKAALLAAEDHEGAIVVDDRHLDAAMDELVIVGSDVRASVFGPAPGPADFPFPADSDADEDDETA